MTFSFTKRDVYRRFVAYLDGTSFEVVSKGRCKCGSGNKTCNACKKATVPRENQFFQVIPGEKLKENYSWAVENLSEDHFQVESLTPEEVAELKELGSFVTLAERLGIIPIGFYPSYVRDIDLRGMTIWCVFQNEADKEKFWDALHHDETRDD